MSSEGLLEHVRLDRPDGPAVATGCPGGMLAQGLDRVAGETGGQLLEVLGRNPCGGLQFDDMHGDDDFEGFYGVSRKKENPSPRRETSSQERPDGRTVSMTGLLEGVTPFAVSHPAIDVRARSWAPRAILVGIAQAFLARCCPTFRTGHLAYGLPGDRHHV